MNPITPEGARKLQAELDQLWKVERPRVTKEVADAAALGDRSENAEYIYGKKRLREIDRRVRYLRKRLDEVSIVQPGDVADRDRIFFGAWVSLEDESGEEHRYRLVGKQVYRAVVYVDGEKPEFYSAQYDADAETLTRFVKDGRLLEAWNRTRTNVARMEGSDKLMAVSVPAFAAAFSFRPT